MIYDAGKDIAIMYSKTSASHILTTVTQSVCCVSLFLKYIDNSATRVDKYNKYVKRYIYVYPN